MVYSRGEAWRSDVLGLPSVYIERHMSNTRTGRLSSVNNVSVERYGGPPEEGCLRYVCMILCASRMSIHVYLHSTYRWRAADLGILDISLSLYMYVSDTSSVLTYAMCFRTEISWKSIMGFKNFKPSTSFECATVAPRRKMPIRVLSFSRYLSGSCSPCLWRC